MKVIDNNDLPLLPMSGILCEESVAFGAFNDGIVISFLESNDAVAFTWEDLVRIGKEHVANERKNPDVNKNSDKNSCNSTDRKTPGKIRKIDTPKV